MRDPEKINLLLISVGSLVGHNLIEIISHKKKHFNLLGTNTIEGFSFRQSLDYFVISPPSVSEEFPEFLERLIMETEPDWVIPCRDEESLVLAKLSEKNSYVKARTSLTVAMLAENFLDKYLSFQLCQEMDIPFAESSLNDSADDLVAKVGFPLVVKPRNGFASIGVKLVFLPNQVDVVKSNGQNLIFQEFLGENVSQAWACSRFIEEGYPLHFSFEEDKYYIQLYAASSVDESSFFIGKHRMKNGISHDVSRFEDLELNSIAQSCLRKFIPLGLRGPLNIQLQKDKNGSFKIFEFNCRFTGASAARYYLGFNELDLLIKDKLNLKVFPEQKPYQYARKVIQTIGYN